MLTIASVLALGPCAEYREGGGARLRELYPSGQAELADVLRDERINIEDRVWLGCNALPWDVLRPRVEVWVERAIRRYLGKSGCPEWEAWAERWLSGEDRSDMAAARAAEAEAAAWAAAAARAADAAVPAVAADAAAAWERAARAAPAARAARAAWERAARAAVAAAEDRLILEDLIELAEHNKED